MSIIGPGTEPGIRDAAGLQPGSDGADIQGPHYINHGPLS